MRIDPNFYEVVVPSFRRPDKVIKFIYSYIKAKTDRTKLRIYFDDRDQASCDVVIKEFGRRISKKQFVLPTSLFDVRIFSEQRRAFGVWNYHLQTRADPALGMFYVCDDTELDAKCLSVAIEELESNFPDGDGVVGLNQANIREARGEKGFCLAGMGLLGPKFIARFPKRHVFCPDYVSFKADAELKLFTEKAGLLYVSKMAKLIHYHPRFFKALDDGTHKRVRDVNADIDKIVFAKRQKLGYLWGENFSLVHSVDNPRQIENEVTPFYSGLRNLDQEL